MNAIDKLTFTGALGDQEFKDMTVNMFTNALAKNGWREAHNGHIYKRLVERGARFGIKTPNEFARALRGGRTEDAEEGAKARVCCGGRCWVIYKEGSFITLRDGK